MKGQSEKMSLEPCSKLTATEGRGAKVKRNWVPDNWSCDEEAPPRRLVDTCYIYIIQLFGQVLHFVRFIDDNQASPHTFI